MYLNQDSSSIARDLLLLHEHCSRRRLADGAKWAAEMLNSIPDTVLNVEDTVIEPVKLPWKEEKVWRFASSLIDCQEFLRASQFTADSSSPLISFIHFYSRYLAGEKTQLDSMAEISEKGTPILNEEIESLQQDLTARLEDMDHFHKYLFALVLTEMNLNSRAVLVLVEVLNECDYFWPAWIHLAKVIGSKDDMLRLRLPEHWMKQLFMAELRLKFQMIEEALQVFEEFRHPTSVLRESPYIISSMAHAYHLLQDLEGASKLFEDLQELDPCRLEHLDDYSNTLFVMESRVKLASLTHHCYRVNKFCPETCCVIGNYYGLRGEHDKAVMYFQRAVKLDRKYSSAWTLMGHEFMELKNTPAAAIAYRHALEVDPNDHRAWFGLGNIYDILSMPSYATYYYNQAHKAKPMDSRFLTVLGDMYKRQKNFNDAVKCYWRAHSVGDMDGQSLFKLGSVLEESAAVDPEERAELKQRKSEAVDLSALGLLNLSTKTVSTAAEQPSKSSFKAPSAPNIFGVSVSTPIHAGAAGASSVRFVTPPAVSSSSQSSEERLDTEKEKERSDRESKAAACYWKFLKGLQQRGERDEECEAKCYKFLSDFSLKRGNWDAAIAYSQCCMQYDSTKGSGKHNLLLGARKREEEKSKERRVSVGVGPDGGGDSMVVEDSDEDSSTACI